MSKPFDVLNYDSTGEAGWQGFSLSVRTEPDTSHGAPWDEEDGHGPVSDWTTRDKGPGELLLAYGDHWQRNRRYYDFAEACRIALRDGWDDAPYNTGQETKRQQAAKAARADFERLRAWCNDDWSYVGVIVTASRNGIELGSASIWGVESDAGDYIRHLANELAAEAVREARAAIERLCAPAAA